MEAPFQKRVRENLTSCHDRDHVLRGRFFFLRNVGDHAIRGQKKTGNGTCVLQSRAGHLRRIDYTGLDQVLVLVGATLYPMDPLDLRTCWTTKEPSTPALSQSLRRGDSIARVQWRLRSLRHLPSCWPTSQWHSLPEAKQRLLREQSLPRRQRGGMQGIFNTRLLFLHFRLGCSAKR